ncbi:MAG: hypothetical protein IJW48_05815 [Clostridia bacterium]|nr:hypothetical protein [Clostridia bacterium]MBQ7363944.1 hypothetical protein [Clostridia bacterium]
MKNGKKCLLFVIILVALFSLSCITVLADGEGEALIDEYREAVPEGTLPVTDPEELISSLGLDALLHELAAALSSSRGRIVSFFFLLLGVSVLIALAGSVSGELAPLVRAAASTVGAFAVFLRIMPLIEEISESLSVLSGFFSATAPILLSAVAMGGGTLSAGTAGIGVGLTLELSSLFSRSFLMTLVIAMFFSGLVSAFGGGLRTVARGVRSAFTKGVGIVCTVLLGLLSLQTLISASSDNMALRAARYASTSILPIVGGTVAGALSTLVGGLTYAKGVIGGSAVLIIALTALTPLVMLLLYKLCFFLAIGFLEFCAADEGVACLSALRDALDALIAVYVITCVVYILEIVLLLKVEVGF